MYDAPRPIRRVRLIAGRFFLPPGPGEARAGFGRERQLPRFGAWLAAAVRLNMGNRLNHCLSLGCSKIESLALLGQDSLSILPASVRNVKYRAAEFFKNKLKFKCLY